MTQPELKRLTLILRRPDGKIDSHQIPAPLEGQHFYWCVRALFPPHDKRNQGGPTGLPGKYDVTITLAKPGFPLRPAGDHTTESDVEGDSSLFIGSDLAHGLVIFLNNAGRDFEVKLVANSQGRLGKLKMAVDANSFADARTMAWRAVSPTLSMWSTNLDIPLQAAQVDLLERRTGSVAGAILVSYSDVGLMTSSAALSEDFLKYASLYREALSTNSTFYQFLCLFKVVESIIKRRERLAPTEPRDAAVERKKAERFPNEKDLPKWLNSLLLPNNQQDWRSLNMRDAFPPEVLGRRFGSVIDSKLRPLRHRIAHVLDEEELKLTIDDYECIPEVETWLPVIKFVVRGMLKQEFPREFLFYPAEGETFDPKALWPDKHRT